MSTARHWRIVGCAPRGQGGLQLSQVQFYNLASARVESSATITSSVPPSAGALSNLNDDSLTTVVEFSAAAVLASGFWIAWDFGADVTIEAIRFAAGGGSADTFLGAVTVQRLEAGVWVTTGAVRQLEYPGPNAANPLGGSGTAATFLLSGDSTPITDSSPQQVPVTVSGTVNIAASPSKFGQALQFNAQGHVFAQNPAFAFGTGDFTVEYWQWATSSSNDPAAFQLSDTVGGLKASSDSISVVWSVGRWYLYFGGLLNTGVNHPGANTWVHVALVRASGQLSLFLDGVKVWTVVNTYNFTGQHLAVGAYYSTAYRFPGAIDDFVFTAGTAKYLNNFTLPTGPATGRALLVPDASYSAPAGALSAPIWADAEDGGDHRVIGTTKNTGTPDTPVRRRVRLHDQKSGRLVRETWSHAVTGEYAFPNLRAGTFYATAFDHTGQYGGVIETDVLSEPMP
ncbi:MAG: LamG-like jellyroll fold domain-containing protein [Hydrogenophaga sp.]|nr:LamG-like jellyroll fold domain-containing protein [Hydrogenophaga sp.]